jgi:hypothetical protein
MFYVVDTGVILNKYTTFKNEQKVRNQEAIFFKRNVKNKVEM